jgi:hypothetical protein
MTFVEMTFVEMTFVEMTFLEMTFVEMTFVENGICSINYFVNNAMRLWQKNRPAERSKSTFS